MRTLTILALLALTLGCDGLIVASGGAIEGGDIAGEPFSVNSAFHVSEDNVTLVVLSDYPGLCERFLADADQVRDLRTLSFLFSELNALDGETLEPTLGEYEIGQQNGKIASSEFLHLDQECLFEDARIAESGFFELRDFDFDRVQAGFDVTMDAEQIRGSFASERCDVSLSDLGRVPDSCAD